MEERNKGTYQDTHRCTAAASLSRCQGILPCHIAYFLATMEVPGQLWTGDNTIETGLEMRTRVDVDQGNERTNIRRLAQAEQ